VKYSWFRTEFEVPDEWNDKQVQLNFQAVDYEATVFINVSTHLYGRDLTSRVRKLDSIEEDTFDSGSMSPITSSEDKRTSSSYLFTTQPIPRVMSLVRLYSEVELKLICSWKTNKRPLTYLLHALYRYLADCMAGASPHGSYRFSGHCG
jgi:hypothetical protein